ncbi:MAG: ABC transporter substrate-binding protein [Candidatus Tectomicrobia bacterium]|nr:ABC transporter substrate-binding protein [Candidatus Tectomicrobia bacterium]
MSRKRVRRGIGLTVLAAVLAAAWGLGLSAPSLAQPKITFATTATGTTGLITTVLKHQKFDEKNGFILEAPPFDPAKSENAIVFKQVDTGPMTPVSLARVNLKGNDMRIFAPLFYNHISLMVQKDSPSASLADLKGKKVATMARVTGMYNTFALVNRFRGLDIEKDYQLVFGAPPVILGLLKKKEVDMGMTFEPITSRLLTEGQLKEIGTISGLWREKTGQPMLMIGASAHNEWLESHQDEARRFTQALLDTLAYIHANPAAVMRANQEKLGSKTDAVLNLLGERMPKILAKEWNDAVIQNLQLQVTKAVEFGLLPRDPGGTMFVNYLKK